MAAPLPPDATPVTGADGRKAGAPPAATDRPPAFSTSSGYPIKFHYTGADVADVVYDRDLGDPGDVPFTRGLYRHGYRGRLWTMRQFAGFGTPEDTNARYRDLLAGGATGLSVAFDLPTLMGRDPDHPLAAGEVGRCGVSVASLADMHVLFDGIAIEDVTTSMTINAPAPMIFAMFLALAEARGIDWRRLSGTLQNDILKEFIAQKEYIYPPRPSMRLVTDVIAFATRHVPRWHPVSVSGYHIREAGATALQELAFTLRNGIEYVEWACRAGLHVDEFGPRLSFFFNLDRDFFEEIAKLRAARRLWSRVMRERFGATDPRTSMLRLHAQTAGASLTAQQPYNNVVRTALQALAGVLGGANSLHTNALDEALALPSEHAAVLALRTQQILAHETGVSGTVDPLGGSWYLERLTADLARDGWALFESIDRRGGMIAAIEEGMPQREIADAAYRAQMAAERGERPIVGVNTAVVPDERPVPILKVDDRGETHQRGRVADVRRRRNPTEARRTLDRLREAALGAGDTMSPLVACARAYCTVGEMCDVLREVWGEYVESPSI